MKNCPSLTQIQSQEINRDIRRAMEQSEQQTNSSKDKEKEKEKEIETEKEKDSFLFDNDSIDFQYRYAFMFSVTDSIILSFIEQSLCSVDSTYRFNISFEVMFQAMKLKLNSKEKNHQKFLAHIIHVDFYGYLWIFMDSYG